LVYFYWRTHGRIGKKPEDSCTKTTARVGQTKLCSYTPSDKLRAAAAHSEVGPMLECAATGNWCTWSEPTENTMQTKTASRLVTRSSV